MSWLFSQALAEEFSPGTSLAGKPFAQLNVMPTQHKFWRIDKMIESLDHSRFGLTSQVLTDDHGKELLMSYLAAFHAKTSAQQEGERGLMEIEVGFGQRWQGSLAKYSPDSCTWKTAQFSLLGDSELFSETWPRWGSMRSGALFLRQIPALPICENEFGLWPTPTVPNGGRSMTKEMALNGGYNEKGQKRQIGLENAVKYWPTPRARDAQPEGLEAGKRRIEKYSTCGLQTAVTMDDDQDFPLGPLNPEWVEWLMGWPIGWTELKPLGMDKFQEWRQQHGKS